MRKPLSILSVLALTLGLMGAAWAKPAPKPPPAMKAGTHKAGFSKKSSKAEKLGATVININTATEQDLERVPGIGKSRAAKIIKMRPYSSVDDLVVKKILSAKELAKVRTSLSTQ